MSRTRKQLLRDLTLYIAVSVIILASLIFAAQAGLSSSTVQRVVLVFLSAGFIFGQMITESKNLWHRRSFWVWIAVALSAHCAILSKVKLPEHIPGLLCVVIGSIEWSILLGIKRLLFEEKVAMTTLTR